MRNTILCALLGILAAGCADSRMAMDADMGMTGRPEPAAEMAALDRFIGTWNGTAEMISPSAEEMNAMMPEGETMPTSFRGGGTWEPALGGMYLRNSGWHEMPGGERMEMVEYMTWDPKKRVYRSWYFSDWGEFGVGELKPSLDGRFMNSTMRGQDAAGNASRGSGTMEFINDDMIQWTWTASGPDGTMELTGTSRRE